MPPVNQSKERQKFEVDYLHDLKSPEMELKKQQDLKSELKKDGCK